MTAKLPPHTITKVEQSDTTGVWTKQTVRYWNEDAVLQAVRDALERARVAVKESKENAFQQSADEAICALLKEYSDE